MDITEAVRRALFEQTFGRDQGDSEEKAELLRRVGVPKELIPGFCRPGVRTGMRLGGCRPADVRLVVEQVLGRQRAASVTVRVSRDAGDAAGHLTVELVEVGPPATPAAGEGGA